MAQVYAGGVVPKSEPAVRFDGATLCHIWSFLTPFEIVTPAIPIVPRTSEDVVEMVVDPAVKVVAVVPSTVLFSQKALMYPTAEAKSGNPKVSETPMENVFVAVVAPTVMPEIHLKALVL